MLVLAAPARASFEGSPGKVVYITGPDPQPMKLWDPANAALDPDNETAGVTTLEDTTYAMPTQTVNSLGAASPPVWSPDGTRIAYVKSIVDNGNAPGVWKHTAIFVYDLRDGSKTQITFPADILVDNNPNPPHLGHTAADWSPAWSPDGTKLAFIRLITVSPDDALKADQGQNMWTVPRAGGTQTRATSYKLGELPWPQNGAVWIPGTNDVLVSFISATGAYLARQPLGAGAATKMASGAYIGDYDVSPDGTKFGYTTLDAGGLTGFLGDVATGTAVGQGTWESSFVRFSNSGDGLLRAGCLPRAGGPPACGLMDRMFDDPEAEIRAGDKDRFVLSWRDRQGVWGAGSAPNRMSFDVQPQTLPVIFIPGFLGSRITCGNTEYWPDLPFPDLLGMSLTSDGIGNAGCPSTGVTGELVETALGSDVYKPVADYVRREFPDRGTLFGWDWRKDPKHVFTRLDTVISQALLKAGPWKDQDAGRVVLWGHSYGGLLIRNYIQDPVRGASVARVLTAGTPYWGSPKAVFPLAFGIESPVFSPMDFVINNDRLKQFARNLMGLYNLYPSDHHPPWLSLNGVPQGQAGVSAFVGTVGGNQALFEQARANHRDLFDGFYDAGGVIDTRIVVGTGKPTVSSLNVVPESNGDISVSGGFANGDGTVPGVSGVQGPIGTTAPLGDPVHIAYQCNVSHVPLPGTSQILTAYGDFLKTGRVPKKLGGQCSAAGGSYAFNASTIGVETARGPVGGGASALRAAGGALSLSDAQGADLIDLIDAPPVVLAVVDNDLPVTLKVPITNGTFTYTPLQDTTQGNTLTYGPLTGMLELAPGAPGSAPLATLDGQPVAPTGAPPTGPPDPGPTVAPAVGARDGATPTSAGPSGAPGPSGTSSTSAKLVRRLTMPGRPRLHGRVLTVKVAVPGSGTVRAVVRRGSGRRAVLGSLRSKPKGPGTRTLTVRLRSRPRAAVRLTITYTPATGASQTVSTSVKPR